jgi:hypothetical protein
MPVRIIGPHRTFYRRLSRRILVHGRPAIEHLEEFLQLLPLLPASCSRFEISSESSMSS